MLRLALGKTAGERLAGDHRADQIFAGYFLVAMAPFALSMLSDGLHLQRGPIFYGWMILSCTWAVLVVGLLLREVLSVTREVFRTAAERRRQRSR
jgi:hypothetical protein